MRPICPACCLEMRIDRVGVHVQFEKDERMFNGDSFKCPDCGSEVIVNFGEPYTARPQERVDFKIKKGAMTKQPEVRRRKKPA